MQPMRPMQPHMQTQSPRPMPQPTSRPAQVYHEADPNLDPSPYQQQYQPPSVVSAPELYNTVAAAHPIDRGHQQMEQAQQPPQQPQQPQQEVSYDPRAGELTINNKVPLPRTSAQELFVSQLFHR